MNELWLLSKRSVRNALRTPEGLVPTIFISVFFLVVNTGSLGKQFTAANSPWLHGNNYIAFQLPVSLLFVVTASGGAAGFTLVTDIENGYFDKLLVAPINRTALLFGQLAAGFLLAFVQCFMVILLGLAMGARIDSGIPGVIILVLAASLFGAAYSGIGQSLALKTRNYQAVNMASLIFFPLLFMAPAAVPREQMQNWLGTAARYNPVSYVMEGLRSLVLVPDIQVGPVMTTFAVTVGIGVVLTAMSLRVLAKFER